MKRDAKRAPAAEKNEETGLPGFRTWSGVYSFAVVVLVVWIALLAWLTEAFT